MRIIAGQRRGHKFDGPKGSGTRPTSDLVRESLFNILGAYVEDLVVVDLFAGTGALGLEALSRGAARAIFVEKKGENVALIHRNMATLRYEDRASVLAVDAYRWARTFEPIDDEPMVVFLDPPYREYEERPHKIRELIENLIGNLPAGFDDRPGIEPEARCGPPPRRRGLGRAPVRGDSDRDPHRRGWFRGVRRTHPKSPTMSKSERARQFAMEVVGKLQGAGFRALWAGGCVRDLMLGLTPADYDVATGATPEQVIALFGRRTVPVGVSFGVVRVLGPHGSGIEVEVATFRSDGAYVDGRRPESVTFSSPELDAARRDFTINGMFLDPFTDEVIDYVGGRADLRRPHPPRDRRSRRPISRGQAQAPPCRPVRRAIRDGHRARDAVRPACHGRPGGPGRRRADRPGTAQDAGRRTSRDGHATGPRRGPGRRDPTPRRLDEGGGPRPAGPARWGCVGPHLARPAALARRDELPPGIRRALARRRQAGDPDDRRGTPPLPRPRAGRPSDRRRALPSVEALQWRTRASHLAGRFASRPGSGRRPCATPS